MINMHQITLSLVLLNILHYLIIVNIFAASHSNLTGVGPKSQESQVVSNVIVIKFAEDYQINENSIHTENLLLNDHLKNSGIYSLQRLFSQSSTASKNGLSPNISTIYLASFKGDITPQKMAKQVSLWPEVVYAEPKFIHYLSEEIPNDTLYGRNQSAYYNVIDAPEAWAIVKGEQGEAVIAIVDGGTDIDHIDLYDNIWQNQVEVEGSPGVDDDGNGFIDDLYGWNFANQSGDPTGLTGTPSNADHGTHTAGIACAVTNNTTGVAGLSWNATVMGINASDEISDGFIKYGMEGIIYAAENGADIISCSWGRPGSFSYFEQEVVTYATSLGALVIAAAGNNNSESSHYPSSYNDVLSIAGTTTDDDKYWSSNYGHDVDLAAPAVNIYSTFNHDRYGFATGTSMSTPMAAGGAGLVKIQHPELSGIQLGEQIRVTSDSLPQGVPQLGRGRLNVYRAVTETYPSIRLIDYKIKDENNNKKIEPGEEVEIYITIQNYLEQATGIHLMLTSSDPYVTISQPEIALSSISMMEQIQPETPFVGDIDENTPRDHTIEFVLQISTNEYEDVEYLNFTVLPGYLNLSINNIKMTVTSLGRFVNSNLMEAYDTVGFSYKYTANLLYEGAIISGTSESQISNAARTGAGADDEDFVVTLSGDISSQIPGLLSDEESYGQFNDQDAVSPMNITISQYTYGWEDSLNDDYIFMRFVIRNLNPTDLNNFHFGFFFDWDIDGESFETNVIHYNPERKMGFAYDTGEGPETHVGVISLGNEEINFRAIYNNPNDPNNPSWGLDDFSYAKKWESISGGISYQEAGPGDVSFVIANGPISIPGNSIHRLAFAMVAADDSLNLFKHADSAIARWENFEVLDIEDEKLVESLSSYHLHQNYPNPFNPRTSIKYELPVPGFVQLSIYNLLGQQVANLISERQNAGQYSIEWDATGFASGLYFYKLQTGDFSLVKKMVVMK